MFELLAIVLVVGAIALLIGPRLRGRAPRAGGRDGGRGFRSPAGAGAAPGTLLITGVSPRPDAVGEQFVTITGVINGPTVGEHVVYQRMAVDVEQWPTVGALHQVLYSPKNPDKWGFAPPDAAPPPHPPDGPPPPYPPPPAP